MADTAGRVRRRIHFILLVTAAAAVLVVDGDVRTCRTLPDPSYHNGLVVDCSNQGLTPQTIKNLNFPAGTTTLIINDNDISVLENNSFVQNGGLKKLMCESCNMRYMEVDALKGLDELEVLGLQNNELSIVDNAFPRGLFQHVPNLKRLYICYNGYQGDASKYSEFLDIFDSLPELQDLCIDSFRTLRIGDEFVDLPKLKTLNVVCKNLQNISGNSFEGFQDSTVNHLILCETKLFDTQIDTMAFQFLPNISILELSYFHIGNLNALKMMRSLQGRQIDEVIFNGVLYSHHTSMSSRLLVPDAILGAQDTKYLTNVCISHFTWKHSGIIAVESGAFMSDLWRSCLKSIFSQIDRASAPFYDGIGLFQILNFKRLESVIINTHADDFGQNYWDENLESEKYKNENSMPALSVPYKLFYGREKLRRNVSHNVGSFRRPRTLTASTNEAADAYDDIAPFDRLSLERKTSVISTVLLPTRDSIHRDSQIQSKKGLGIMTVRLPPRLTTFAVEGGGSLPLKNDLQILDNNFTAFYYRKANKVQLLARVIGFNRLKTIDFTSTHLTSDSKPEFFHWFPSLTKLVLKDTETDSTVYSQIAKTVPTLEYYDISSNHLVWLSDKTFSYNKQLKYLNLADNRFSDIPFDLGLTPNLKILDLRMNSLNDLPQAQRQSLDEHIRSEHELTLLLDRNPFSCTCSALPFLKWLLMTTTVRFDKGGNYSCFSQDGTKSYTASYSDIKSFWRQCQGRDYFLISLTLTFTLATVYLGGYLGTTHKTQIISKVMQLVSHDFRLQTRRDFVYDVCVGYADQDVDYVRHTLLRYLESMWHLRTFVHQRDLLHDPLLMSHAIRDSWRNVLLITENFLDGHAMAHNIMKVSTFFVSPSNPRSVVVMVEESVRHRVPDYVLQVVHEDNIIVLPGLLPFLHYEAKEALKDRILR